MSTHLQRAMAVCGVWLGITCMASVVSAQEPRPVIPEPFDPPTVSSPAVSSPLDQVPKPSGEAPACDQPSPACSPAPAAAKRGSLWHDKMKPCLQDSWWGWAEYFDEVPFGALKRAHLNTQVCNGQAAQMFLYRYDFCDAPGADRTQLNPSGIRRLFWSVDMVHCCGLHPIGIECTGDAALDGARRAQVLAALKNAGAPVSEAMVVVRMPPTAGVSGTEAGVIYGNLVQQTRSGGATSTASQGQGQGQGMGSGLALPQQSSSSSQ